MNVYLSLAQRLSALVMAPLVVIHLVVMVIAVQNGLSAEEILGRTRGSLLWGSVYGLFVLAVSIHAAIGLRTILTETLGLGRRAQLWLMHGVGLALLLLGGRAVYAVVA